MENFSNDLSDDAFLELLAAALEKIPGSVTEKLSALEKRVQKYNPAASDGPR